MQRGRLPILLTALMAATLLMSCGSNAESGRDRNDANATTSTVVSSSTSLSGASSTTVPTTAAPTTSAAPSTTSSTTVAPTTTKLSNAPTTMPAATTTTQAKAAASTIPVTFPQQAPATTVPVTTTTLALSTEELLVAQSFNPKLTCAKGGVCRVGDIGPAGGKVFRVDARGEVVFDPATKALALAHYWEMAPRNWSGTTTDLPMACSSEGGARNVMSEYVDTRREALLGACGSSSAPGRIAAYQPANRWYLPTVADLETMQDSGIFGPASEPDALKNDAFAWEDNSRAKSARRYWTSDFVDCGGGLCPKVYVPGSAGTGNSYVLPCLAISQSYANPTRVNIKRCRDAVAQARPIRAFGFTADFTCAFGGKCVVGDIGPSRGLVMYSGSFASQNRDFARPGKSTGYEYVELMVRPDLDLSEVESTIWCSGNGLGATSTGIGYGITNSLALVDSGSPSHLPCEVLNSQIYGRMFGINLPPAPANADQFEFIPSRDELETLCRATLNTPINKGYFEGGRTGTSAQPGPWLEKAPYDYCGLSTNVGEQVAGIWSSSLAGSGSAWAWSFKDRAMVKVPIADLKSDKRYVVVTAREGVGATSKVPRTIP